jgi:predicted SAM-dependent methyltransferase
VKLVAKRIVPSPLWDSLGALWARIHRGQWRTPPALPTAEGRTRLNVGSGTDYREGFINIDGSATLPRVDRVIDFSTERLTDHFEPGSVDHILANDIIEHQFHWEAVSLLAQFFDVLRPGGTLEVRVPDCEYILGTRRLSLEQKLRALYGGQDVPLGRDEAMDESRKVFPQYFCHKYGWTQERMRKELHLIGFRILGMHRRGKNFVTSAMKPTISHPTRGVQVA